MKSCMLIITLLGLAACQTESHEGQTPTSRYWDAVKSKQMTRHARESLDAGRTEEARRHLDGSRLEGSQEYRVHALLARTLLAEGRYSEAEREILMAEELGGDQAAEVALVRGTLAEARGRWEQARMAYGLASTLDPDDPEPVILQARTLHAAGETRAAVVLLERELAGRPPSFDLYMAAADAHLANDDAALAVSYYREALAMREGDVDVSCALAFALSIAGQHGEALDTVTFLGLDRWPDHLKLALGRSALVEGKPSLASRALRAYLDRYPSDAKAHLDLARTYYLLSRFDSAHDSLNRSLNIDPEPLDALVLLGHIHSRQGHSREAMNAYLEAIRKGADAAPLAPIMEKLVASGIQIAGVEGEGAGR